MRIRHLFAVLAISSLAVLTSACDGSSTESTLTSEATGGVGFRLSSADSAAVSGTVDSILLKAISGSDTLTARGPFGSPLSLSNLPTGRCVLQAYLFSGNGTVRWSGYDTVQVKAGEETQAMLVLHMATGSIRVNVVLDSSTSPTNSSFTFYSTTIQPDYPGDYAYTLNKQGDAARLLTTHVNGKTVTDTLRATLGPAALAKIHQLLDAPSVQQLAVLPRPIKRLIRVDAKGDTLYGYSTPVGGSTTTRSIIYADGHMISVALHQDTQIPSATWDSLNSVDSLLAALFPPVSF
jgi:hypothetical protein